MGRSVLKKMEPEHKAPPRMPCDGELRREKGNIGEKARNEGDKGASNEHVRERIKTKGLKIIWVLKQKKTSHWEGGAGGPKTPHEDNQNRAEEKRTNAWAVLWGRKSV